ncbi:MAG: hypothetical protein WKF87_16250 [Chryseolinea sp.]
MEYVKLNICFQLSNVGQAEVLTAIPIYLGAEILTQLDINSPILERALVSGLQPSARAMPVYPGLRPETGLTLG